MQASANRMDLYRTEPTCINTPSATFGLLKTIYIDLTNKKYIVSPHCCINCRIHTGKSSYLRCEVTVSKCWISVTRYPKMMNKYTKITKTWPTQAVTQIYYKKILLGNYRKLQFHWKKDRNF